MQNKLKVVSQKVNNYIDTETGELIETSVKENKILVSDKDTFSLIYTQCMNVIEKWDLTISDLQLFAYLVNNYNGGQMFSVTVSMKKELSIKTNKSHTSYNNSTRKLVDKKLIVQVSPKTYRLNPTYIWAGTQKARRKAIIEILEKCEDCI